VLDVKNGLLMLPPECERESQHVNGSSRGKNNADDESGKNNDDNDNPTKSNDNALTTQEISSTIMGISSTIVDLDDTLSDADDVNTSMETVTMTDVNGNQSTSPDNIRNNNPNNNGLQHHHRETTFRQDVRDEWVDAMFGRDFFPTIRGTGSSTTTANHQDDNHWKDLSVKQGMGGANVGNWVTYGALLDANNNSNNHGNNNNNSSMKTPQKESALATLLKTKSTPLMTTNSVSNLSFGESLINVRSTSESNNLQHNDNNNNAGNHHAAATDNNNSRQTNKIGATISRIPLGIYVRSIALTSEAYTVGISPGSILIDINGLGLLGETSYRAVERLWHYAGDFLDEMGNVNGTTTATNNNLQVKKPIQLRFYKNSQVYTVFLMSSTPLKGIEWAPCGNFALVQRSSGLAAQCGVRRGSLVLAVNGVGLRQLDHAGVAKELIENYAGGSNSVVLTCGYTPATSRSGFYEEKTLEKKSGGGSSGVEVRPRPVEYSTALSETFFACTAPSVALVDDGVMETTPPNSAFKSSISSSVRSSISRGGDGENLMASELAAYVAAGGLLPTDLGVVASQLEMYESSQQQRRRINGIGSFGPCPSIQRDSMLDAWNPLVSLTQSMSYQSTGCCETSYMEMGGPFRIAWGNESYGKEAAHTLSECIRVISGIAQHPTTGVAENVFDSHLMQLLGVATCAPHEIEDGTMNLSEKLLDILVDVALNDINLCQRLFFLLRCFIGASDDQVSEGSAQSLKLLRHAQRRLSGKMLDKYECQETNLHCNGDYLMSSEKSSASSSGKVAQLNIALTESCSFENRQVVTPGAPANRHRQDNGPQEANNGTSSLRLESSTSGDCLSIDGLSCQTPASTMTANSNGGIKKKIKSSAKIRQLFKGGKSKSSLRDSQPPSTGLSRSFKQGSTFSFTKNMFHKQPASLRLDGDSLSSHAANMNLSMSQQFENLAWILCRIDATCSEIEKKLIKSFPQKMANLALKPWSASKESALASITQSFQAELRAMNPNSDSESHFPILNPIDSSDQLTSVDADECFILPSAHFPMLLCFNSSISPSSPKNRSDKEGHFNSLYRTKIEIIGLSSTVPLSHKANGSGEAYIVQGAVGGIVQESGTSELYVNPTRSSKRGVISHRWTKNNTLIFESSSNSGPPKTLSLKISTVSRNVDSRDDVNVTNDDMGCAFIDLTTIWKQINQTSNDSLIDASARVFLFDECEDLFDQHGEAEKNMDGEEVEIQIKVTVEVVPAELYPQKRLLLFKHGDDLRQELLAIQFIEMCNQILKSSGLDLKLKTFRCLPVEARKGFIEWVSGTVPLSQLCRSTYLTESNVGSRQSSNKSTLDDSEHSLPADEVTDTVETSAQGRSWCKYQAIRGIGQISNAVENPIQDFLRAAAYDKYSPYYVKKEVMDTYVKSCAGYCVITYLLGVGDRHLDNILLHQNGHLLHCDFSFILGHDPKTYLPMRITDEMIRGFGGQESDNYAKFISFIGAAFLTLRRHNNLHSLLSQIRNMIYSNLRDLSLAQPPIDAIFAMKDRFQLDLSDDEALSYIEHVVEKSITSKMWRAVDAMHSLGKHF